MEQIAIDHKAHRFEEYNICPFCQVTVQPTLKDYVLAETKGDNFTSLFVAWKCTGKNCLKVVSTEYVLATEVKGTYYYNFKEFLNGSPAQPAWPTFIKNLKNANPDDQTVNKPSKFTEIYSQSLMAEFKGLTEIAGIGYRKALEFLFKDLAIEKNPADKDKIIKASLSQVIKEWFSTSEYLPLMERATWLGNDETHYERKHPGFDVQHLKRVMWYVITDLDGKNQREQLQKELTFRK